MMSRTGRVLKNLAWSDKAGAVRPGLAGRGAAGPGGARREKAGKANKMRGVSKMTDKQREKLAELLGPKRTDFLLYLRMLYEWSCVPVELLELQPTFVALVIDPEGRIRWWKSSGAIRENPGDFIVAGMMQVHRECNGDVALAFAEDHLSKVEAELEIAG